MIFFLKKNDIVLLLNMKDIVIIKESRWVKSQGALPPSDEHD